MAIEELKRGDPVGASVPGVQFLKGRGGLPMLRVETGFSEAEIYLQGAHVTHFQAGSDAPLLFLSEASRFEAGQAIRGGVPVILPWFGPREGMAAHGVARNRPWEVVDVALAAGGGIRVTFHLDGSGVPGFAPFAARYAVTVSRALELELTVRNLSPEQDLVYEDCFHSYFSVRDITAVSVHGLQGVAYRDKVAGYASKIETSDAITISSEVDRVYTDTTGKVEIHDSQWQRRIVVEKENSASTVLWNPWIAKARQMADFGGDEFHRMLCVESGNVGTNRLTLAPGKSSSLKARLSSTALVT